MATTPLNIFPMYGYQYQLEFPIYKNDGTLITAAAALDSEKNPDGAGFSDCTNEATEYGATGIYYLLLTAAEMTAGRLGVQVKTSSASAVIPVMEIFPAKLPQLATATAQAGAAGTITLVASANATNNFYNGMLVAIISGTGAGQVRFIVSYVGATKIATVFPAWDTQPANDSVYEILDTGQNAQTIRAQVDASVAAGVKVSSFADDAITAASINTGAFTADAFAADAIVAATLATGVLTADAFAANAIVAATLANDCITAAKINTGALTADAFAADAIVAATLATGCLTADAFAADALVAATFATGAFTADAFAANAITATALATDAITAAKIAADAISSSELAAAAATEIADAVAVGAADEIAAASSDFRKKIQSALPTAYP